VDKELDMVAEELTGKEEENSKPSGTENDGLAVKLKSPLNGLDDRHPHTILKTSEGSPEQLVDPLQISTFIW
jgi:hypothetical protein